MWQRHAETKKRTCNDTFVSVQRTVEEERERVSILEKEEIVSLEEELVEWSAKLTSFGEVERRAFVRRVKDVRKRLKEIEERLLLLRSGQRVLEFDKKAEPYMKALEQCHKSKKAEDGARGTTAVSSVHQKEILTDFVSEVRNDAPKIRIQRTDVCPRCCISMRIVPCKAVVTCTQCGYVASYLDATTNAISYGEEQIEFTSFSYKRINHFNDHILFFQGRETMRVPPSTLKLIMEELCKQRISNCDITHQKVREVLKRLKLKNYEHVTQIVCRLTGRTPPRMSASTEEMCRLLFKATQPAFEKNKPADRSNYLSYSFTLYKILELLGESRFLSTFSLLKGKEKLSRQDEIWRSICEENDWEFIPTV